MLKHCMWVALIVAMSGAASADEKSIAVGRLEYINSCAICHGADGRAQTPFGRLLRVEPPSLRLLAKKMMVIFHSSMFTKP